MISTSNFLAFIALIISSYTPWHCRRTFKSQYEINQSSVIYIKHLQSIIPKTFHNLQVSEESSSAAKEFLLKIRVFKLDILYFKYTHRKIYHSVIHSLEEIEKQISKVIDSEKVDPQIIDAISSSLNRIYKAFFNDLPDDRIEQYFKA